MTRFGAWLRGLVGAKEERPDPTPALSRVRAQPVGSASFAEHNNDFALAMYGQLRQRAENLFFSPFSVRAALGMTHAGTRGETAAQMRDTLRISSSDEALHVAFAEIIQRLNAAGGGEYEMSVANSLWCQDGAPLQPEFLDLIARYYGGGLNVVDFGRGADAARVRINRWVEEETRRRIQELIPSGGLGPDTCLVLVNAVYFKGMWVLRFRRTSTRDQPFHVEGGGTVEVPLMYQHETVRYLEAPGYQAVDLDYRGGDLSMLVLLPARKDGLWDLEKRVSARELKHCVTQMETCDVKLFLPRFKVTWGTVDLGAQLAALGMPFAFTRFQADFSGINGREPPHEESLFLSAVFHKAFVEMNEEGTEAAAATAFVTTFAKSFQAPRPRPVPVFRADHPFLFAIRDRKSGAILFLGRMADPTRES